MPWSGSSIFSVTATQWNDPIWNPQLDSAIWASGSGYFRDAAFKSGITTAFALPVFHGSLFDMCRSYLLSVLILVPVLCGIKHSHAADQTLDEFKKYAADKLPAFSPVQLDRFAKGVDADSNGVISDAEFANRAAALNKMAAAPDEPASEGKPEGHQPSGETDTPRGDIEPVVELPRLDGSEQATILLITAVQLVAAWKPFAEWKTRCGKPTKIISIGQIAKAYKAESIQEQIRLCVRDHIDSHGTRWVVLGGDSLPGGKGLVPGGHRTVHAQEPAGIPTDIVYLSKTNWDADGDGVFGEWKDDREAISYPDGSIGLGRVPVRTADDVAAFIDKVIAYESRYPTTDFAKQMIYTCTDSPAYPKVRQSWDGFLSKVWTGGNAGRFFSQETPWDKKGQPGSHQLNAENLIDLINGRTTGKLHIHGHGHLPAWVLERSSFTAKHVGQLKNEGAYPLITTVSCNTGEYDSRNDPSIVELMIRQPQGGSVAVVAPIRTGKAHFHSPADFRLMVSEGKLDGTTQTMTRYWSNGLSDNALTTGESLMKAKSAMANDAQKSAGYHLCICELNLLGDPTLDMRASAPRTPKLEVPQEIAIGRQTLHLVTDAPGCTLCVWKGSEVYQVVAADDEGKAELDVAPSTSGELSVTASGATLNVATAKIAVGAEVLSPPATAKGSVIFEVD